jgi:HEPN domain-containing protein
MKYTAIEWLVEQLEGDDAIIARVIGLKKYNEIYKKAKEMEKEQIKDAFVECWKANMPDGYECKLSAEEYYNETFKNK